MTWDIKLQKMSLTAYEDIEFKKKCGETVVQINPDTFTRTLSVRWNEEKSRKSKNGSGQFSGFDAERYSFTLYFDGTGVVDDSPKSVKSRVDEFLATTYKGKGTSSSATDIPVYVIIGWCGEQFKCKADSITVKYTLFDLSGAPLRANLTCTFSSVAKPEEDPQTPKPPVSVKENVCPRITREEACGICSDGLESKISEIIKSKSIYSLIAEAAGYVGK